jgi:MEDS: MEthanogen/methylotroph, DcmR Sensory domain
MLERDADNHSRVGMERSMNTVGRPVSARSYHAVRFYENEKSLAQMVGEFLAGAFEDDSPAIFVATPAQRGAILRELVLRGVDVVSRQRSADLILIDAQEMLSSIIADDTLDGNAFTDVMTAVIQRACRGRTDCTIRIYGQMVDVLWQAGKRELAIDLEMCWNQLAATQRFSLLCGYAMGPFYKDAHCDEVCGQHTHIVSADGTAAAVA